MAQKGKEVAGKAPAVKRKKENVGKVGARKRKNPGVLQFFDVAADVREEEEEESEEDGVDQALLDEVSAELNDKNGFVKAYELPILPKEEELSGDELEKYLEERYKTGSHHVKYAGDECGSAGERDPLMPSRNDPTIWRIKCMVGRERQIVFSLIQKYVNLHSLGSKLKIVSAFALEHTKGFFYIEAERQSDILEACKGLCNIYVSRISAIPNNEVSRLFSVRNTKCEVPKHMWARLKHGKYKGDLAQVVSVEDAQKRATVKLLPRIDLQALAKKLAGGGTVQEATVPAPRIISSSDLEGFRHHVKSKRDRLTGEVFETIDGLTIKDGYLYKTVSVQSLRYLTDSPSADELEKFNPSKKDKSDDMEWLSQLYGEKRKKCLSEGNERTSKGGSASGTKKHLSKSMKATTKGLEDTLDPKEGNSFQLHDLVFFGENDFGVIVGMENDNFEILTDDLEGAKVVNVDLHEMKSGSLDKKFSILGKNMIKLSLNDVVRVLEGPFEGKQGVIRHICKETIFIYDENQLENGGYFCANSQLCENISNTEDSHCENDGDRSGFPTFEVCAASPKSPELPSKKRWEKENTFNSNRRGDKDCNFSIGQTLRIRVGPLKGHICRVVAVYRSDVTVKLDSQIKVITVRSEHLSEAGVKSIRNHEPNFMGSFDGFETQGPSGATTNGSGWNSAALTTRRNPWPNFSSSEFLLDSTVENPFSSNDPEKGEDKGDSPWVSKTTSTKVTDNWGKAAGEDKGDDPWGSKTTSEKATDNWGKATGNGGDDAVENKLGQVDIWDKSVTSWDRAADNRDLGGPASSQWGPAKYPTGEQTGSEDAGGSWDTGKLKIGNSADFSNDAASTWGKTDNKVGNWSELASNGSQPMDKGKAVVVDEAGGWNKGTGKSILEDSWGKAIESSKATDVPSESKQDCWNSAVATKGNETWGSSVGSWTKAEAAQRDQASGWNSTDIANKGCSGNSGRVEDAADGWAKSGKKDGDSWNRSKTSGADGTSSWSRGTTGAAGDGWNKPTGGDSDQQFGWNKSKIGNDDPHDSGDKSRTFDGGRGTGGRRGRGGRRGGNRDQFHGGRSFGRGQSSDWNPENYGNHWTGGESSGNSSSGWNKGRSFGGGQQSNWDGATPHAGGNGIQDGWKSKFGVGEGSKSDNWNNANSFNAGESSGWKTQSELEANKNSFEPGGTQSSGWDGKVSNGTNSMGNQSSSLDGNQSTGWDGKASNWSNPKSNQSSGWNGGSVANDEPKGSSDGGNGWNRKDNSNVDQVASWKAGPRDSDGSNSNWSTLKDSGGTQSSSWSQKPAPNKGTEGIKDQEDGWNRGKASGAGWATGSKNGENDKGGAAAWGSGSTFSGDQSSGWGRKANESGSEGQSDTLSKRAFGNNDNGGNWRGGNSFGRGRSSGWNRGSSDNDGSDQAGSSYGARDFGSGGNSFGRGRGRSSGWNRGSSDNESGDQAGSSYGAGDFGSGRSSSSNRGGFGNRGRGRRGGGRFGGWNRGQDYSDKTDAMGVSGSDHVESWNQGGFSKGQWQENNDSSKGQWQQGSSDKSGSFGGGSNKGQWQKGSNNNVGNWGDGGSSKGQWQKESIDNVGSWDDGGSSKGQWQKGSSDNVGSWGGGGSSKGQWQKGSSDNVGSWGGGGSSEGQLQKGSGSSKEETGSDGSQASGWNSQRSGWNQTGGGKESGGWNSGAGSRNEGGDGANRSSSQGSGWIRGKDTINEPGPKDHGSNWKQPRTSEGSDWLSSKKGTDPAVDAGGSSSGGSWNKGSNAGKGDSWGQPNAPNAALPSSGWNKPTDAKEEANANVGQAADPWDKASSGSWGKKGW